jgi:hypothetical protein
VTDLEDVPNFIILTQAEEFQGHS